MDYLTIYDVSIDQRRQATQDDIDKMQQFIASVMALSSGNPFPAVDADQDYDFQLAVFKNPMREDCVFVSENKEIEPYESVRTLDGAACYPATPSTKFKIGIGLSPGFAAEIVRRWNAYKAP